MIEIKAESLQKMSLLIRAKKKYRKKVVKAIKLWIDSEFNPALALEASDKIDAAFFDLKKDYK